MFVVRLVAWFLCSINVSVCHVFNTILLSHSVEFIFQQIVELAQIRILVHTKPIALSSLGNAEVSSLNTFFGSIIFLFFFICSHLSITYSIKSVVITSTMEGSCFCNLR